MKSASMLIPAIPVAFVLISTILSPSCANTTQAPTGGVKDTIPPVIVSIKPEQMSTMIPLNGAQLVFTFNEYVVLKNPKSIYLSPPQNRAPKSKIKGRSVVVSFEEDLLPNTTYTLNLNDAIADNNEGNVFPGFTYVFSTGQNIDSMMVTGIVQDCNTLAPMKGVTVMLYKNPSDSAFFLEKPYAAALTDDWGFFCIRNIQDTLYRLYALKDGNANNIYDPSDNELVAFADSSIRPVTVVNDSLPELQKFDMKDTLNCLARKTEYELNMFREKPARQMIMNNKRVNDRYSYITFNAQNAHIDSIWLKGFPSRKIITQFNLQRDSLEIWVNDRSRMPDTLHFFVNYKKTDSLGTLRSETEKVSIYAQTDDSDTKSSSKKKTKERNDTLCTFKATATAETIEQNGFDLLFEFPVINEAFDSIKVISINPKQQESTVPYTIIKDSCNLRHFSILPRTRLMQGYEYKLKIPHRGFRDINGFYNDSLDVKVSLPSDEKLSSLSLNLTGVTGNRYFIDLLNEKHDNVLRSYVVTQDCTVLFPYLKEGKYSIRLIEDINGNSYVDTGSILEHRQPEKVVYLKFNGDNLIKIPEMTQIEQEIDLQEL